MNKTIAGLLAVIAIHTVSSAQTEPSESSDSSSYIVPRTEHGQPDLQAVWSTVNYTMLERPPGLPLVLPPEMAAGFAQQVYAGSPENTDPDIDSFGTPSLNVVKGEHRASVIVSPEDGRLPFNERGLAAASHHYFKGDHDFDHPEQRPGVERCIEGWGTPPIRTFMYKLHHGIVQTGDTIAIVSEDNAALRVIHMDDHERPDVHRSITGHSVGHWEGDVLVVETTHFRGDIPDRATIDRPMLISAEAVVTERFERVSDNELFYAYEVNDPYYYTEPFRGEISFNRDEVNHIYEYSCHEGNYSMVGALRGERVVEVREELGLDD